ncbi:hypothetical protein, partial [uncultured Megasphaera sp.]|uniref:hypothetical protein n=1 Tax=uncultured Megasphaera sp. TaxID=165188 RepID=UPI0028047A9E
GRKFFGVGVGPDGGAGVVFKFFSFFLEIKTKKGAAPKPPTPFSVNYVDRETSQSASLTALL